MFNHLKKRLRRLWIKHTIPRLLSKQRLLARSICSTCDECTHAKMCSECEKLTQRIDRLKMEYYSLTLLPQHYLW